MIAAHYEMSFAEVVRRGLEYIVSIYKTGEMAKAQWQLPVLAGELINPNFSEADFQKAIQDDEEKYLLYRAGIINDID